MLEMVGLVFHSHPASWTQRNKATIQNCLLSSEIGKKKNIYIYIHTHTYIYTYTAHLKRPHLATRDDFWTTIEGQAT